MPGGNAASRYPISETTFGSLIVHAIPMSSPRWATARSQNRAKRSTIAGLSQPPSAAAQRGVVKWWNVTTGSRPLSRQLAIIRR